MLVRQIIHDKILTWHPAVRKTGLLQSPPHDRIMTSRKQPISLQNKKLPVSLIVSQHNLPLPAPGLHPYSFLVSAPWSHHVPRPLLEVWAALYDLWAQWCWGQNTDCFAGIPEAPVWCGRCKPRGTVTGYGITLATSSAKWHRISVTRQAKQSLFSPHPVTQALVYKETAAVVLTPR